MTDYQGRLMNALFVGSKSGATSGPTEPTTPAVPDRSLPPVTGAGKTICYAEQWNRDSDSAPITMEPTAWAGVYVGTLPFTFGSVRCVLIDTDEWEGETRLIHAGPAWDYMASTNGCLTVIHRDNKSSTHRWDGLPIATTSEADDLAYWPYWHAYSSGVYDPVNNVLWTSDDQGLTTDVTPSEPGDLKFWTSDGSFYSYAEERIILGPGGTWPYNEDPNNPNPTSGGDATPETPVVAPPTKDSAPTSEDNGLKTIVLIVASFLLGLFGGKRK